MLLGACASEPTSVEVEVPAGEYQRAFAAARTVVREYRFHIDRVDAAAGVISTNARPSSGIFTPWDPDQSTFEQELDDTLNFEQRRVRVTFAPHPTEPAPPDDAPVPDLRETKEALVCRFEVVIERYERPGRRVPARAVRRGTQTMDPELRARNMWPTYTVPIEQDPLLAARLAQKLRETLEQPIAPETTEPAPETPASP